MSSNLIATTWPRWQFRGREGAWSFLHQRTCCVWTRTPTLCSLMWSMLVEKMLLSNAFSKPGFAWILPKKGLSGIQHGMRSTQGLYTTPRLTETTFDWPELKLNPQGRQEEEAEAWNSEIESWLLASGSASITPAVGCPIHCCTRIPAIYHEPWMLCCSDFLCSLLGWPDVLPPVCWLSDQFPSEPPK